MLKRAFSSILACCACVAWVQIGDARVLEPADLSSFVEVSSAQISPGGDRVAYVLGRWNSGRSRYEHELRVLNVATKEDRVVLAHAKNASSPLWAPDGQTIGYLAPDPSQKNDSMQLFRVEWNGQGGPHQMTHIGGGVMEFAWSPSGKTLAIASRDAQDVVGLARHGGRFEGGDDSYTNREPTMPIQIWIVPISGAPPLKLTEGPASINFADPSVHLSWSPDERSIATTRVPSASTDVNDKSVAVLVDVNNRGIQSLTGHQSLDGAPSFSPDGQRVAFRYPRDGDAINAFDAYVAGLKDGPAKNWTRALDREISGFRWMPDSRTLLVGGVIGTRTMLWLQADDQPAISLPLGDISPVCMWGSFDVSVSRTGRIAFVGATPHSQSDIYVIESTTALPRRLTSYGQRISSFALGGTIPFEWDGPDGFRENAVVTLPPGFSNAETYPVVVLIHGSIGASVDALLGSWPLAQLIAARGYIVFQPNYRGSDSDGNAYQHAIFNDSVLGPGRDIMAGLEAFKKLPFVDGNRIAVSGVSYGGLLTSWLTTQYHFWRAAIAGAAPNSPVDQYNESGADNGTTTAYFFGGSPYSGDRMKDYAAQSPLTYAKDVTTPTLIWSTTGDPAVPVVQSFAMYHALQDNHVPVRFVLYPGDTHGPANPVQAADITELWVEWLDKYMK
jgi:dipeptidyl aminopeptidase/acylaminoacyl peptidase